jgi:PPOX class probable F420-dependent enzyme
MAQAQMPEATEPLGMRRRGFIAWSWVDRLLWATRSIWVSTTRPDGRPHTVPVWYTWDGRTLYFATHESAQKARNLRREPRVVLHAGDGDDVIILEGQTEVVTDDAEVRQVDATRAAKYVDPRTGTRDTILAEGTILYRVRVQHVMAWMYGDMAGRTDWWLDAAPTEESHAAHWA